jgi:hypothetical protein
MDGTGLTAVASLTAPCTSGITREEIHPQRINPENSTACCKVCIAHFSSSWSSHLHFTTTTTTITTITNFSFSR